MARNFQFQIIRQVRASEQASSLSVEETRP
jgi:hypothetical protein